MASQTTELLKVVNRCRPNLPHEVRRRAALGLVRAAMELSRINEAECSEELPEGMSKWLASRELALEERCRGHATKLGIEVRFNGDPRGFAVLLHFGPTPTEQPGNTWGGAEYGWGVG